MNIINKFRYADKKILLSAFGTLLILGAIPVTVFLANNIRDQRSRAAAPTIDITSSAVQTIYQTGVPQIDTRGNTRTTFGPDSFFPNGIYYPTTGSLATIGKAGFNSVILTNAQDPNSFLTEAATNNVKLIPNVQDSGHCQPVPSSPSRINTYLPSLKTNPNIIGWHLWDDPLVCHSVAKDVPSLPSSVGPDPTPTYNFLNNEVNTYGPQTSQPLFAVDAKPFSNDWTTWWNQFAVLGEATAHYNYPFTVGTINSIKDIADLVTQQTNIVNKAKPSWFVLQDWAGSFFLSTWRHPNKTEARAMAYTSIIHGATGLFHFAYDSAITRADCSEGVIGIAPNPQTSYPGACKTATASQIAESKTLWNSLDAGQNGINKEILSLEPVILSPTATDTYQVLVDQAPISTAPIRTMLKKYGPDYYLFAVNLDNATINTSFNLTGKSFTTATVLFENRSVSITGGSLFTDSFSPFATHVYKLSPNISGSVNGIVSSSRKVCSLLGPNQINAGIGGQDGGTSLTVGGQTYWTFGDSVNLSKGLFLNNSAATSNDFDASDCLSLTSKSISGTAQNLLPKLSDEFLVWPDGMVSAQSGSNHFFYMSVRSCKSPEPCAFGELGAWKVRGIGLAKFDTTTLSSTRVGSCSPVTNCLFWQESDLNGFDIAGATAFVDSGYVYVFLNESPDGVNQVAARLARVPLSSIENKLTYQYWNGSTWVSSLKDSLRLITFPNNFNGVSVSFNKTLGKWTAIYTTNNFSTIALRTSLSSGIAGRWTTADQILVDCKSIFPTDTKLQCYFGRQHPEFSKNNDQTIYVTYANSQSYQTYLHEIIFKPFYSYGVKIAGTNEYPCCGSNNPSLPVVTLSKTFYLTTNPDPRGYEGIVCAPDCATKVVWTGPISFSPNAINGSVILTPAGGVDTTKPTVSFSSPSNNQTVSKSVNFSVNATDNVGVNRVEVRLDGQLIKTLVGSYSFGWDSYATANGSHTLSATAFDMTGNSASATINITINNSFVYWVHIAGVFETACCGSGNPTSSTTNFSNTFTLAKPPDSRGYVGVVCSPDCSGKVVWTGTVYFSPNSKGGNLTLTPTGQR